MDLRKQAFILEVIKDLQLNRSSPGRNNIQKCLFILKETAPFKLPFEFVLHRQGPHSFDLEIELDHMKSSDAISARPTGACGDEFAPGSSASIVIGRSPLTPVEKNSIAAVCEFVGRKSVEELEGLAAAVWVRNREHVWDRMQVAKRVHQLKPHVPIADAQIADSLVTSSLKLVRR